MEKTPILGANGLITPEKIAEKAWESYDTRFNYTFKENGKLFFMFDWGSSKDGFIFWDKIYNGEYEHFYNKYPKSVDSYSII